MPPCPHCLLSFEHSLGSLLRRFNEWCQAYVWHALCKCSLLLWLGKIVCLTDITDYAISWGSLCSVCAIILKANFCGSLPNRKWIDFISVNILCSSILYLCLSLSFLYLNLLKYNVPDVLRIFYILYMFDIDHNTCTT